MAFRAYLYDLVGKKIAASRRGNPGPLRQTTAPELSGPASKDARDMSKDARDIQSGRRWLSGLDGSPLPDGPRIADPRPGL